MAIQYQIIPVTPFEQNCSLLWCDETKQAAVVDPGGDIARILKFRDDPSDESWIGGAK